MDRRRASSAQRTEKCKISAEKMPLTCYENSRKASVAMPRRREARDDIRKVDTVIMG